MAIEWLAGNRIRGTSTERTSTSGFTQVSAVSGGWKEVGRTTLGSAGDTISVSSLPDKKYYMILGHIENTGGDTVSHVRANSDSSANYALRRSVNGGADSATTSDNRLFSTHNSKSIQTRFIQGHIANKSDTEKLGIFHVNEKASGGSGTAPSRIEGVGKHVQTSSALNELQLFNDEAGSFDTGGELVVLGYDPDDTHTDNFWEQLADVTLGSDASEISSGTITAKKYLWVQVYFQNASSSDDVLVRFNNDTGNNYAHRHNMNYEGDSTATSQSSIKLIDRNSAADRGRFVNFFVINNSATEKLLIAHGTEEETSGANNHPTSSDCVGIWSCEPCQITEIDCFTASGNIRSGARLRVWGSN